MKLSEKLTQEIKDRRVHFPDYMKNQYALFIGDTIIDIVATEAEALKAVDSHKQFGRIVEYGKLE